MSWRFRTLAVSLLVLLVSNSGWAQPARSSSDSDTALGGWSTLLVPGGTANLERALGLDATRPRGLVLLDVIRVAYEVEEGKDKSVDQRRARLLEYLEAVSRFERARAALPATGISIELFASRRDRRPAEQFARAIGAVLVREKGLPGLVASASAQDARRRELLRAAGLDIQSLLRAVNAGSRVPPALPADEAPSPLPEECWRSIARPPEELGGCLFTALMGDRRAALLYYGLSSVDAPTRAYLAAHRDVLAGLASGSRPGTFATLGRSVKVRDGRVDVPGGAPAVESWEALAGTSVTEPGRFILALMERGQGRLALFYDTAAHLDRPMQAAMMVDRALDGRTRIEALSRLNQAFTATLENWDVGSRPFVRVTDGAGQLLLRTHAEGSGVLSPPSGRQFWQAVFENGDIRNGAPRLVNAGSDDVPLDPADMVRLVCVTDAIERRDRVDTWLFAHRVFGRTPPGGMRDALLTLRAFPRFRLLMLTLERMGISDASVYGAAAWHALQLSEGTDHERLISQLTLFQGALSIVERARFSRVLSQNDASRLVLSLSKSPLTARGEYAGAIAGWLDSQLLPALGQPPAQPPGLSQGHGPIESRVIAAIAGLKATRTPAPVVVWEGLRYSVDIEAAEFARLTRVREKQGGPSLDAVLGFCLLVRNLPSLVTGPASAEKAIAAIQAAVGELGSTAVSGGKGGLVMPNARGAAVEVVGTLRGMIRESDFTRLGPAIEPLERAGDGLLALVLSSIAYAPHLGDPDSPALLAGDPALRHDYGIDQVVDRLRVGSPWQLAEEQTGEQSGWRASGSLLALDVSLARLSLRRAPSESMPAAPTVNDSERAEIEAMAAIGNPFDLADVDQRAVADALRRGRALVADLPLRPDRLAAVIAAAPVGNWRSQILPWALDHEPQRLLDYFSAVDLIRIAEAEGVSVPRLAHWGAFGLTVDGCLCQSYPDLIDWESYAGVRGRPFVVSRVPDLALKVAETLDDLGLSARLTRAVMSLAVQELLDLLHPAYADDWSTLVGEIRRLPRTRMEDFIAALTTSGPLVPAAREGPDVVRH